MQGSGVLGHLLERSSPLPRPDSPSRCTPEATCKPTSSAHFQAAVTLSPTHLSAPPAATQQQNKSQEKRSTDRLITALIPPQPRRRLQPFLTHLPTSTSSLFHPPQTCFVSNSLGSTRAQPLSWFAQFHNAPPAHPEHGYRSG